MYNAYIDKEALALLPTARYTGTIYIIDTIEAAQAAVKTLSKEEVLGFDTETKASFNRGERFEVSLLQIATHKACYLFRLHLIGLIPELCQLLESPDILKVGLSIHDDYIALRRRTPFEPGGFVELQKLCPGYGIREASLQKIYALMYNKRMSKAQRLSNWEARELSPAQQGYAALDAVACLEIFDTLLALPHPHPVAFAIL